MYQKSSWAFVAAIMVFHSSIQPLAGPFYAWLRNYYCLTDLVIAHSQKMYRISIYIFPFLSTRKVDTPVAYY